MNDKGIVRNRLKIQASINNAKHFLQIQKEFGSFNKYIWKFTAGQAIINNRKTLKDIPSKTPLSDEISRDIK